MKTIINYFIKEIVKEFVRERRDKLFQDGFEFAALERLFKS